MSSIKVSVLCMVYNHEKYLRECLDSLVTQKTDFDYEIIVHDDASTDGSADIISEYANKYPDLIVPILQTDNKVSKGVMITSEIMVPAAKGEYIAFIEGDDYWVDKLKLQKQADALDAHPECHMSAHKVERVNLDGEILGRSIPKTPCATGVIESEEVVKRVCKEYTFHTSSMFCRTETETEYGNPMPKFRKVSRVGDEPRVLYYASKGGIYFFDESMSHYRKGVKGSYTTKFFEEDREKREKAFCAVISMLKEFDSFSGGKYHSYLYDRIHREEVYLLSLQEKYRKILSKEYRDVLKKRNIKSRVFIFLGAINPAIPKTIQKLSQKVHKNA